MPRTIAQNSAPRKGQDIALTDWQHEWVPNDYAKTLHENLTAAMKLRQQTPRTLAKIAFYLDGPKKGRKVSLRSLQYLTGDAPYSPSVDVLAAVAAALDLLPWQLLVKGMDPGNPPVLTLTDTERQLYAEFKTLREKLSALPVGQD